MAIYQKAPKGSLFPLDFGISERLGIGQANPNISAGGSLFQPASANAWQPQMSFTPQVQGASTGPYGPTRANFNPQNTGGGGSGTQRVVSPSNNNTNQGQSNQPDNNQLVDAIYNPVRDFLNQMQADYEAQQAPAQANIESSFGRQLTPINQQETTQLQSQDKQEGVVNTGEQNALAQARQLHNELSQSGMAKYGTGSSAGAAVNELLGRQTAKQFGAIGQEATTGRTAIETERGNIKAFAAQKRADLTSQKEEAIRTLQSEFKRGMMQINQMKAQNESAKASARLELVQQAQAQAAQIEQADRAYQRAIDQFERESAITAQQNAAFQSNQTLGGNTVNAIQQVLSDPRYVSKVQKVTALASIPGVAGTPLFGQIINSIPADKQDELTYPGAGQ